mmetsp:Transcript_6881/g.22251  ORF Transcript_6881/g.22251 Transcript_6881/m.22251 type:complete len:163 (-) Transcript_6881:465-953(-)
MDGRKVTVDAASKPVVSLSGVLFRFDSFFFSFQEDTQNTRDTEVSERSVDPGWLAWLGWAGLGWAGGRGITRVLLAPVRAPVDEFFIRESLDSRKVGGWVRVLSNFVRVALRENDKESSLVRRRELLVFLLHEKKKKREQKKGSEGLSFSLHGGGGGGRGPR